jgi:hypothetical protein
MCVLLTIHSQSRVNSDPCWLNKIALNFNIVKNLKTCIAVILYVGYIILKAEGHNANNGLDTKPNKALNLAW